MSLEFRKILCESGDLSLNVNLSLCSGLLVALMGPNGSGKRALLEVAGGLQKPNSGEVFCPGHLQMACRSFDSVNTKQVRHSIDHAISQHPDVLLIGPGFALTDPIYQAKVLAKISKMRRSGVLIILLSHDLTLTLRYCDEVILMDKGHIVKHGDPQIVLEKYRAMLEANRNTTSGPFPVEPSARHGDGRAEVSALQVLDSAGQAAGVIRNGESISVRVRIRYLKAVQDPVIGILIRSRIGVNVYGTNTELENLTIGPCTMDEEIELFFRFNANLCAQDYTLTVASHDRDGIAHEWLEDAVAFTISDTRYTAGVADLKAKIDIKRRDPTKKSPKT